VQGRAVVLLVVVRNARGGAEKDDNKKDPVSYGTPGPWLLLLSVARKYVCPSQEGFEDKSSFPKRRQTHAKYAVRETGVQGEGYAFL
jgi:hypothetical protein